MANAAEKELSLYERELSIFRKSISDDLSVVDKYYGYTLLYSLPPDEFLRTREQLGFKLKTSHEFYNYGVLAAQDEEYAQAVKFFDKALKDNSEFPEALHNRAYCLEKAGKKKDALKAWEQYLQTVAEESVEHAEVKEHIGELKGA